VTSTTLTIDQIRLSPFNVRTRIPPAEDTVSLEASILVEGLRVPIDVHRLRGSKAFGTFAGRRRYFAIKRLVERGDLAPDWPVPHRLHEASDAELTERSITENLIRTDMEEHELYAGVAKAAALGHAPAEIARNLGQSDVRKVERWMRLGQLAPPVFGALADRTITIDQAIAYAGTHDRDLQAATFARLPAWSSPTQIRAALKIGDTLLRRQLTFVGEALYRAAGGRYELDLFAEQAGERGRVVDEGKLAALVEEKMAAIRAQVRLTTGTPELRFVAAPPLFAGQVDNQLAITPVRKGERLVLPDNPAVVACIQVDAAGEAAISYWWETRKAKYGGEKPAAPTLVSSGPIGQPAATPGAKVDPATRREEGLGQDATFVLSAQRKAILRAALIDDAESGGDVALDYLVFAQARALLGTAGERIGMRAIGADAMTGVSHEAHALAHQHLASLPATQTTASAIARLRARPFFTEADLDAAFLLYREEALEVKNVTAALVAGFALDRSLATDRVAIHDVVAHLVDADRDDAVRRRYWTPSAELLDLFPKEQRRAIGAPFVDRATHNAWSKLKSDDLTAAVHAAVTRAGGKGGSWVHPLLRFTGPELAHRAIEREAAE
jgi:ParB-like chromosome segregation protein Spo0J